MTTSTRSRPLMLLLAAGAVVASTVAVAAPAMALGSGYYACGNGTYLADSTSTYAESAQNNQYACGYYYARAHYSYNGVSYYTSFAKNSTDAIARPGYSTVDYGNHYTDTSGTVTK